MFSKYVPRTSSVVRVVRVRFFSANPNPSLSGDQLVEYVNGELEIEHVKQFDINLEERTRAELNKITPMSAHVHMTAGHSGPAS